MHPKRMLYLTLSLPSGQMGQSDVAQRQCLFEHHPLPLENPS